MDKELIVNGSILVVQANLIRKYTGLILIWWFYFLDSGCNYSSIQ